MTLDINDYTALTYVRKPYEVLAIEVTNDNIEELAPFIGVLGHKSGTPFIKSQKNLVGSTFRVWPGFFVTVLNGKLRCYSRRMFFNQFAEMTPDVKLATAYVLGDRSNPAYRVEPPKPMEPVKEVSGRNVSELRERLETIAPVSPDEVREALGVAVPVESLPEPQDATAGVTCEHGYPLDTECPYKNCQKGVAADVEDTSTDEVELYGFEDPSVDEEGDFFGAVEPDPVVSDPEPAPTEPGDKPLAEQINEMLNRGVSETYLTDEDES